MSPLICFEVSPNTHFTASIMFDFPQPFGPIIAVLFSDNDISVLSTNDLNPEILIFVNLNIFPYINNNELFCINTYL